MQEGIEVRVQEAMREIARGVNEIIGIEYIQSLVERYYKSGETFSIKAGFDPTAPDLHLGHTVLIQKMATFQKHGAIVTFLIGDYTAMIGDPTGKSETRKPLTREQVLQNAQSYQDQVFKILDPQKTVIRFNSEWLEKLGTAGMIELTAKFSVARMLERDDFEKRYKSQTPISLVEFIYPLLQGYDSVALESDVEFGGTDQKFNLLMGRHLQRSYGLKKEQSVLMVPILEGLDGVQKMSKSLGNYIGVTEEPNTMYAKVLSVSDELMWRYYELLSAKSLDEIHKLQEDVKSGNYHPKKAKEDLALEITTRYHSEQDALQAKEEFDKVFARDEIPSEMPELGVTGEIWICKAMVEGGISPSTSQARRDIQAGSVKINQTKVEDINQQLGHGEHIIQVGKRKFLRLIVK
ncbi:tyrosine--tRNA ligase [Wolinella succinogenes]|uniref:Tyrosine--tRNA ligase n=1 Tax=Wolinella succinogenes (strain ATCC 29543 / DSM 1740 / CCUG 13145 / JCM 31913 / LMG 7466 / NCTC 11488 / FDC 602W) TaxID=273121 RepID=SYY_WOLSU|nr:tyrosine--tRNA ligase [Wolinella succinogenes]Q7MAH6.1 RecName: Full=Tyrosine--tRNA ligase; AltName: Full=Tyrosyl-tRNA synthetase; Short=TyrRS [Wolinella succinogenes DSM 1740]HCZ18921.1 tyrosine--tRNA ligase [Helicobacter sp.]NLU34144.1 tyrosine--tRNA ligase [Wolinella succinogenes]CAE09397.1 TYROSYL-TRNA SYNTHETASE [Wolinella succinogenes]VEG81610.1 Tyrosine--tRNA ligase [Wolinella succinogenes]